LLGFVKDKSTVLVTWHDPYVTAEVKSTLNEGLAGSKQVLSASLDMTKTAKVVRIQFLGEGDYVTIAKAYRKLAKKKGWLVTWKEKMKKQIVVIGIIVLLVCVGLSGCNQTDNVEKNRFIGTWTEYGPGSTDNPITYEFFSNGTVKASREEPIPIPGYQNAYYSNWKLKDGKLIMTLPEGLSTSLDYHFFYNIYLNMRKVITISIIENAIYED
jgi:hypothetical protein